MKGISFLDLDDNQKINYVKKMFFNYELNDALDILLLQENKSLKIIKTIKIVLKDDVILKRIKDQFNLNTDKVKYFVYSKILSILAFYSKNYLINNFFKTLDENEIKGIAFYEYQNRTAVSLDNRVFNKYCSKYKIDALKENHVTDEEYLLLTTEMTKYNLVVRDKKKPKNEIPMIISVITMCIIIIIFTCYIINCNVKINEYKNRIFPGIYLDNISLEGLSKNELRKLVKDETLKLSNEKLKVYNVNDEFDLVFKESGITFDDKKTIDDIINYNDNLSWFNKVSMVKNKDRYKTFYINSKFDYKKIDSIVDEIETKFNVNPTSDKLVVDSNYNVYYDKGTKGFTVDNLETKKLILNSFEKLKNNTKIKIPGKIVENEIKYKELSNINKKIVSFRTYFENVGNRGHNIVLASSKLNKTLLMPGDIFSYLKVVGPYDGAHGYRSAPIYLNGVASYANGGGVCQLATTLYNAQLRANLEIVYRTNHSIAPKYVPRGLDATVYSKSVDFKFKNQYKYPVFITSYVKDNYVYVDIWSNENLLGNKTYEPYSYFDKGGYVTYLKEFENGKYIGKKYLNKSFYKR